jgi:RNA-binding protein
MDQQLTSADLKRFRRDGRRLGVTASVGKAGLTDALAGQVRSLLDHHELVKVRVPPADKAGRMEMADELARRTGSTLIDLLGRTVLLYKPPQSPS